MIDLDALEKLARAAGQHRFPPTEGELGGALSWTSMSYSGGDGDFARFYAAANPAVVLELIGEIRRLEAAIVTNGDFLRAKLSTAREALERIEDLSPIHERERRDIAREALEKLK